MSWTAEDVEALCRGLGLLPGHMHEPGVCHHYEKESPPGEYENFWRVCIEWEMPDDAGRPMIYLSLPNDEFPGWAKSPEDAATWMLAQLVWFAPEASSEMFSAVDEHTTTPDP